MGQQQLVERYENALKALRSFEESIALMQKYDDAWKKNPTYEVELEYKAHRDSVIKRFEFSLDSLWKYLKFFLEARLGVVHNSPKPVIRECFKNKFINEQEALQALEMINARNMTSHIYREEIAEQIWSDIPQYYILMNKILTEMKPKESRLD